MLNVRNISTQYDGLKALSSVSLNIEVRDFVCVLGPNGAGKSTLLQTVAGIASIVKERSSLTESRPWAAPAPDVHPGHFPGARGRVALPPNDGGREPAHGSLSRHGSKEGPKASGCVFHLFPRLEERKPQLAETLSGGERQMLAVGRGLMSSPRLLVLDEPSLGLAPLVIKEILETLIRINSTEKITILLAEQNIFHALNLSRRGYLLENGRMVLEGSSADLLRNEHIKKNYLGL